MVNNNLINNKPIVTTKVTESWKTPKRRYEMKPRKINKVPEEIKEAGEEAGKKRYI